MSSYKPRRRRKEDDRYVVQPSPSLNAAPNPPRNKEPLFPLEAFLWPARHGVSQWIMLPLILMVVGLFRWTAGLWSYSGFQRPPMHGDFEAQRHWMEITTQLPMSQWYFHDIEWWGLDYPPLTAYHSWLCGKIGTLINPSWFALYTSRGSDDHLLKVFMRATVITSEYAIYIPAVIFYCRYVGRLQNLNEWTSSVALTAVLMQPSLILIDHVHFQYNTVMLGFVVACITSIYRGAYLSSCIFFVAALGFKQMALYYAPAIFAYLLGVCIFPRPSIVRLCAVSAITAISFLILFAPLLLGSIYESYYGYTDHSLRMPTFLSTFNLDVNSVSYHLAVQLGQVIHRVFPFSRGLFEDKVANFWCTLHTFHKLNKYPVPLLQRVSLGATLVSISPPCFLAFLYPRRTIVLPAFAATAWGFFLFSFQVHEKSALVPLLPMTLMLCGQGGLQPSIRAWVAWANIIGSWTMYPLLKRVDLLVPYFVVTLLWVWLMGVPSLVIDMLRSPKPAYLMTGVLHGIFYVAIVAWHISEALITPSIGKPDLWVVLNVLIGTPAFGICYLWCLWKLWEGLSIPQRAGSGKSKSM